MKQLLIRADDLGFTEAINYGIEKSVKQGLVRSVGVMTNMEAAAHGLNLLKDTDVCYGLHTNICAGRPLVDPKLIPSITTEDGYLKSSKEYRSTKEDFVVLNEVILEIEAQYERFVELVGHKPSYFEGHAVASQNFFQGLEIVAKRHDCDYFGMSFTGEPVLFKGRNMHVHMDSMFPGYDPYVSLKKAVETAIDGDVDVFIAHPGYLDDYILTHSTLTIPRTKEVVMLTDPEMREWLQAQTDVEPVTYDTI